MRLFLTGGTGLVGSNVLRVATERRGHEVFAGLHTRALPNELRADSAPLDLGTPSAVRDLLAEVRPDAVIHCAYLPGIERVDNERERAWAVMVEGTRTLALAARELEIPLVFVSTDMVFDGRRGPFAEDSPPNPVNYYGVLKVVGETLVTATHPRNLVARVAGVFGVNWARPDHSGSQDRGFGFMVNETVARLRADEPFTVWTEGAELNEAATPTLASDAAETMLRLLERGARGRWHCVGGEGCERLELARAAARAFDLDPEGVRTGAVPPQVVAEGAEVAIPRDTRLDARATFAAAEREPLSLDAALARYRRQRETGALA